MVVQTCTTTYFSNSMAENDIREVVVNSKYGARELSFQNLIVRGCEGEEEAEEDDRGSVKQERNNLECLRRSKYILPPLCILESDLSSSHNARFVLTHIHSALGTPPGQRKKSFRKVKAPEKLCVASRRACDAWSRREDSLLLSDYSDIDRPPAVMLGVKRPDPPMTSAPRSGSPFRATGCHSSRRRPLQRISRQLHKSSYSHPHPTHHISATCKLR